MKRLFLIVLILLFAIATVHCGSNSVTPSTTTTTTKPAEPKGPTLYTAQDAFTRLNGFAHKWAPDATPIHVTSVLTSEANGQDGRATIWHGMFASPSRGTVRTFICSGSTLPNAPALGVTASGAETQLTPPLRALFFEPFLLKTDSKQAFEVTQKNGGDKVLKKNPKTPVNYILEGDRKLNAPVWYVIYGDDTKESKDIGVVNAATGNFVGAKKAGPKQPS